MSATIAVETLVVSHPNADFDAFAGMLAAQLLYPGARICLHGGVNRNVREFYNLHADEIPAVEPSALERDSVRRLVSVEVTDPSAWVSWPSWPGATASRWWRSTITPVRPQSAAGDAVLVAPDGSVVTGMLRLLIERGRASRRCMRPRSRSASTRTPGP